MYVIYKYEFVIFVTRINKDGIILHQSIPLDNNMGPLFTIYNLNPDPPPPPSLLYIF